MTMCACSCAADSENDAEVVRNVRARKRWRCVECSEPIEPGQRYELYSILYEGRWTKTRTCLLCAAIRDDLCDCFAFGTLKQTIWDCLGFDYLTGADNPDWVPSGPSGPGRP